MVAKNPVRVVRENLQAYADRGVFRGFSEVKDGRFKFVWLTSHPMTLEVHADTSVLQFKRLLPGVPASSSMYAALKRFIRDRQDDGLPDHRRIDPSRAEVCCSNRRGFVSISLKVQKNQYSYGVNRLVNLVHEIFLHLRDSHPDYLGENFDVLQE